MLDDLGSVTDPDGLLTVGARVLVAAGELALLSRGRWIGAGKWLVRRLAQACPQECAALTDGMRVLAAAGNPSALAVAAGGVIDVAGGRHTVGYRRVASPTHAGGSRPDHS